MNSVLHKESYFFTRLGLNNLIHMDSFYDAFTNFLDLLNFGYLNLQWWDKDLLGFIKYIFED